MAERFVLARLRIKPAFGFIHEGYTVSLEQNRSDYYLAVVECDGQTNKKSRRRVALSEIEVQEQLASLKQATVPAFPVSPEVCDGSYIELTVKGEFSTLTLGWWTIAPQGAERFSEFADWMREHPG